MDEFLPEQKKQLKTWAFQRDGLLRDISVLRTEKEALTISNNNLVSSNTDVQTRVNILLGRLEELNKKEEEYKNFLKIETAGLVAEKTKLQSEIPALKIEIEGLEGKKNTIINLIDTLIKVHDKVFDRTGALDSVVAGIVKTGEQSASDIGILMAELKKSVQELIDKSSKNIASTDIVLEKLPKYIFELQRPPVIKKVERIAPAINKKSE